MQDQAETTVDARLDRIRAGRKRFRRAVLIPFGLMALGIGMAWWNMIGVIGNTAPGDLVRQAVDTFRKREPFPCEGAALPEFVPGVGFSDEWSSWQEGYPVLIAETPTSQGGQAAHGTFSRNPWHLSQKHDMNQ